MGGHGGTKGSWSRQEDGGEEVTKDIEALLLELKDTSELMIDLAYSALLYDNEEIAKEVLVLEEVVDKLNYNIQRSAFFVSLDDKNVDKAMAMIRLAYSIEAIADAATEIADVVLRDIEPHPIIKMSVMDSDVIITRTPVSGRSPLVNKTLGQSRLMTETGMWVAAVKRGKTWIYGPDENTGIKKGDVLFARGPREGEEELLSLTQGKINKKK
ncbi:MAG: PhoU family transcriptional regulator [Thermoplasmata archaeon]|nr:MAG: PhoU family transcriptional regulator [Thermoplasmata archaeon]